MLDFTLSVVEFGQCAFWEEQKNSKTTFKQSWLQIVPVMKYQQLKQGMVSWLSVFSA